MSWFRLDDQMPSHPKIALAGGDAAWLWVCAGCWCAQHDTDGRIPKAIIPRLSDRRAPMKLAARLVEVGMLEESGDYFVVHDYLDFNPSADEVAQRRARRIEAGRLGGKRSGESRRSKDEATGEASASASAQANGKQRRTPIPIPPEEPNGSSSERRGYTRAERDPMFRALCALFGEPKTRTTKGFYGKGVTELLDAGATPEDVARRGACLKAKNWSDSGLGALLKHWHSLGTPSDVVDVDAMSRRRG